MHISLNYWFLFLNILNLLTEHIFRSNVSAQSVVSLICGYFCNVMIFAWTGICSVNVVVSGRANITLTQNRFVYH